VVNEKGEHHQFYSSVLPLTTNALVWYALPNLPEVGSWITSKPKVENLKKFGQCVPATVPLAAALVLGRMKVLPWKDALELAKSERFVFPGEEMELAPYDLAHVVSSTNFDMLLGVYTYFGRYGIEKFVQNDPIYWPSLAELLGRGDAGQARVEFPPPGLVCLSQNQALAEEWAHMQEVYSMGEIPEVNQSFVERGLQKPDGLPYYHVAKLFIEELPAPPEPCGVPFEDWELLDAEQAPPDANVFSPSFASHAHYSVPRTDGLAVLDSRHVVRVTFLKGEIVLVSPFNVELRRILLPVTLVHPSRFRCNPCVPIQLGHLVPRGDVVIESRGEAPIDLVWDRAAVERAANLSPRRPPRLYLRGATHIGLVELFV